MFKKSNRTTTDYLINQKVFDTFYKSLKGKQILVYSGLHWNQKEYLASEIFDLTEEEKSKINHQMIDEIDEEK
ncbi:replication initiation protein [Acinetobacter modestus]|nr:replication initiation protein [Acinetobacter modestus]